MDDQILFNTALEAAHISWKSFPNNSSTTNSSLNTNWEGHTPNGLKVTLLSLGVACRGGYCQKEMKEDVYIWHHGKTKHRIGAMSKQAEEEGVWFLRKDWSSAGGNLKGIEWLTKISTFNATSGLTELDNS